MKGSTIDAMSDAVDNAAVFLYGCSLAYKESANCRLEANYAHQQQVEMIPLLMTEGYKPTGACHFVSIWLVHSQLIVLRAKQAGWGCCSGLACTTASTTRRR